jgi:hypothetical protein
MRLSGLSFSGSSSGSFGFSCSCAAVTVLLFLLFSGSTLLAQHGGGGGGGGGASGGGGGGSHGGGGGSSGASSGGGHSSGGSGSGSHGSGSHNSGTKASRGAGSSGGSQASSALRSNTQRIRDITRVPVIEPVAFEAAKATPQKRGFFSFLRHPFRKPEAEPVAAFQHRICRLGACRVCPVAQVPGGGGCVTPHIFLRNANLCSRAGISSGACQQTNAVDDCSGLRAVMERQARRMQVAEAARQNACSSIFTLQCTDLAGKAESEVNLYGALQQKFNQCMERSRRSSSNRSNLSPVHGFDDFRGFGVDMDRP